MRGYSKLNIMDLSKAYNFLPHDLLIAKLEAYGFDNTGLALITDYLKNHLQQVKIGATFSLYLQILRNVAKGSILGPILFNLFINDPVFCNFANNTTIHSCS